MTVNEGVLTSYGVSTEDMKELKTVNELERSANRTASLNLYSLTVGVGLK